MSAQAQQLVYGTTCCSASINSPPACCHDEKKKRKRVLKSFEVCIYICSFLTQEEFWGAGFGWVAPSAAPRPFHPPLLKGSTHPVSGIVVSSVVGCNLNKICVSSGDHCYLLHKKIKNYCENLKNDVNEPYPKAF